MITIYHNGECSKSKGALEILQEHNVPHNIRYYLQEPLNTEELKLLLGKLGIGAAEIIRKNEPMYIAQLEGKELTEEDWIAVLAENPVLMERPVVEKGDIAIIARPPEKVLEII